MAQGLIDFLIAGLVSLFLIGFCTMMFYETLAHIWIRLARLKRHRDQILLTIFGSFIAHTIAVWAFGLVFYALTNHFGFGDLAGGIGHGLMDYVYFSAVSYSSLGLGDVYPTGGLRLLVGVEAILGLILIGWTVTFTYLVMEKYLFHRRNPGK